MYTAPDAPVSFSFTSFSFSSSSPPSLLSPLLSPCSHFSTSFLPPLSFLRPVLAQGPPQCARNVLLCPKSRALSDRSSLLPQRQTGIGAVDEHQYNSVNVRNLRVSCTVTLVALLQGTSPAFGLRNCKQDMTLVQLKSNYSFSLVVQHVLMAVLVVVVCVCGMCVVCVCGVCVGVWCVVCV